MVAVTIVDSRMSESGSAAADRGAAAGAPVRRSFVVRAPRRSAAPARPRRMSPQVYRRRRVAVFGSAVFTLLGLWVAVAGLLGAGSHRGSSGVGSHPLGADQPIAARSWVVRPGDTLWSIALASGVRGDVRPLVDRLSAEVGGQPLQPGEIISLP